jgi:hypothetical protein
MAESIHCDPPRLLNNGVSKNDHTWVLVVPHCQSSIRAYKQVAELQ